MMDSIEYYTDCSSKLNCKFRYRKRVINQKINSSLRKMNKLFQKYKIKQIELETKFSMLINLINLVKLEDELNILKKDLISKDFSNSNSTQFDKIFKKRTTIDNNSNNKRVTKESHINSVSDWILSKPNFSTTDNVTEPEKVEIYKEIEQDNFNSLVSNKIIKTTDKIISSCSISDGKYALGYGSGKIELRDSTKDDIVIALFTDVHNEWIRDLIFNKNNLISACDDTIISIWDLNCHALKKKLFGHSHYVTSLVNISDELIASGSGNPDNTIRVWNIESGLCQYILKGHISYIYGLIKLEHNLICSVSRDKTIRIWNIDLNEEIDTENRIMDDEWLRSICHLEKDLIAVGTYGGNINFYSLLTKKKLSTIKCCEECVLKILKVENSILVTMEKYGSIKIVNYITKEISEPYKNEHLGTINTILNVNDKCIITGGSDGFIIFWKYYN